jgi:hypothetical protein
MGFWSAFALGALAAWTPALLAMIWFITRAPCSNERTEFDELAQGADSLMRSHSLIDAS